MSTREDEVSRRVERLQGLLNRVRSNGALLAQQRSTRGMARASSPTPLDEEHDERDVRATSRPAGLAARVAQAPARPSSAPPSYAERPSSPVSFNSSDSAELPDAELLSIPPSEPSEELPSVERTNTDWLGATTDTAFEPEALRQADSHRTLAETPAAKSGESARVPAAEESAEIEELTLPELESDPARALSDVPPPAIGAVVSLDEGQQLPLELEDQEDLLSASAPPSDASDSVPPGEDGLEAELPRTSYTGFDSSLSAPPSAREELAAHDRAGRQRFSSIPVSEQAFEAPDDLPPVLSSPPTAGAPSVPGATRQTQIIGSHTAATDAASFALEQQPALNAEPAVFEGAPIRPEAPTFLELLDRSLNLSVRR